MSKVSRSTYQKLAEENKRLKADIKALVMRDDEAKTKLVFINWHGYFKRQKFFDQLLKEHAKEYIQAHKEEFPSFLTENLK
jgi:hypothetical protein